ncbi:unnamed protein product, partial [Rotaria magnacalcarata]
MSSKCDGSRFVRRLFNVQPDMLNIRSVDADVGGMAWIVRANLDNN